MNIFVYVFRHCQSECVVTVSFREHTLHKHTLHTNTFTATLGAPSFGRPVLQVDVLCVLNTYIRTYIRVCVYMYEHNECIVRGCYSLVLDHCSMFEEFSTFSRPSLLLPAMPLNLLTYGCHCRQQVSLSSSSIGIIVTVHPQTSLSLVCIPMCVCMYFGVYISVSW